VQLQFKADPLITASAVGAFSFTGKNGAVVSAALPQGVTNRFAGVIGFEVTNVPQGGSTNVTVSLPRTIALTDPSQSAYLRYNYANGRFEEFVDAAGNPLYALVDRNVDGVLDGIQLKLVDGDSQWDGDGVANGTVVDPGTLVEAQRNLIGNNKANRLIGNVLANSIDGRAGKDVLIGDLGNDTLKGRSGNDRLDGGEGADLIIGGGGRDRYIYRSVADSTIAQSDTIRKLSGKDRFNLRKFDAEVTFTFIGNDNFSGSAGELRATRSSLQADLNGDGAADFRVNFSDKFRLAADQLLL
jgi:Ca2+-binding RTX toxin-like protein